MHNSCAKIAQCNTTYHFSFVSKMKKVHQSVVANELFTIIQTIFCDQKLGSFKRTSASLMQFIWKKEAG